MQEQPPHPVDQTASRKAIAELMAKLAPLQSKQSQFESRIAHATASADQTIAEGITHHVSAVTNEANLFVRELEEIQAGRLTDPYDLKEHAPSNPYENGIPYFVIDDTSSRTELRNDQLQALIKEQISHENIAAVYSVNGITCLYLDTGVSDKTMVLDLRKERVVNGNEYKDYAQSIAPTEQIDGGAEFIQELVDGGLLVKQDLPKEK